MSGIVFLLDHAQNNHLYGKQKKLILHRQVIGFDNLITLIEII